MIEELSLAEVEEANQASARAASNRRAPRVAKQIAIELHFPDHTQSYKTRDISYVGIFIEHPDPLPLRKLMRLSVHIDEAPEAEPLQMLGVVANRVNANDAMDSGVPAGMGIQVFALGHDVRSAWRHFVRQEYEKDPAAREEVRRQEYPSLKVHFSDEDEFRHFATEDVASGDVFVRSADLYQQGTRVWLEAIHPVTQEPCSVEAIVLEFVESPRQKRGVRVMFPDAEVARDTLLDFLAPPEE